jgi:hypothetical protein
MPIDSLIPEARGRSRSRHGPRAVRPFPLPMRLWHETHVRAREAATDSAGCTVHSLLRVN